MEAIYYQSFNWAERILEMQLDEITDRPRAVVLDIDETVLDNSPQSAQQIIDGVPFSYELWDEWCSLATARPLPGSVQFTKKAAELGYEVFYISNRGNHLLGVTLKNLIAAGFANADSAHVLLKTDTSVKDSRREKVRETHKIALLIGDNLGDFSGFYDDREDRDVRELVRKEKSLFGTRYIILPNPMYGSWEKQLETGTGAVRPFRDQKE
jgi:5'-nucleotidase (lipoprotein e(P4) family)